LISTTLDRLAISSSSSSSSPNAPIIWHFTSQPGVCHTNVAHALVGPFLDFCKLTVFYLVRLIGSTQHPISPLKSAIASVHLALVPLTYLAFFSDPKTPPVRYGAETDRWGTERVGISPVKAWLANEEEGRRLVVRCDELLDKLKSEEERGPEFETASEKM
jgi:3-keto steroid reductase